LLRSPFIDNADSGHLYREAEHTGHASKSLYLPRYKMQSLGHAWIFCTYSPIGQIICFAWYVFSGNPLGLGSNFCSKLNKSSNPLSDKPLLDFISNSIRFASSLDTLQLG